MRTPDTNRSHWHQNSSPDLRLPVNRARLVEKGRHHQNCTSCEASCSSSSVVLPCALEQEWPCRRRTMITTLVLVVVPRRKPLVRSLLGIPFAHFLQTLCSKMAEAQQLNNQRWMGVFVGTDCCVEVRAPRRSSCQRHKVTIGHTHSHLLQLINKVVLRRRLGEYPDGGFVCGRHCRGHRVGLARRLRWHAISSEAYRTLIPWSPDCPRLGIILGSTA